MYETTITSKPASIIMLRKQLLPVQMKMGRYLSDQHIQQKNVIHLEVTGRLCIIRTSM